LYAIKTIEIEKEIFDLLLEIKKEGKIIDIPSTRMNAEQRELDSIKERKFNVLIKHGLISNNGNNVFIITEYGYDVAQHNSWIEYLEHRKKVIDDKFEKEKYDLKISKFQAKNPRLPYYLSGASVIIALFALFFNIKKDNDQDNPNNSNKVLQKKELLTNNKSVDTTLTIKEAIKTNH
tara:strand:+ start:43 stop:576 length:534 start_codon:yes stop_codon:yes gene_type:complete